MEPWVPLAWSLAGLSVWLLVLGGVVDHWRTRHPMPSAVIAAAITAAIGSAFTLTISAWRFIDTTAELSGAGHFQRAMLLACGVVALMHLVRSRRRW